MSHVGQEPSPEPDRLLAQEGCFRREEKRVLMSKKDGRLCTLGHWWGSIYSRRIIDLNVKPKTIKVLQKKQEDIFVTLAQALEENMGYWTQ